MADHNIQLHVRDNVAYSQHGIDFGLVYTVYRCELRMFYIVTLTSNIHY